ncbi:PREDICTED: uncharacterized protein LOC106748452 [Dinoponera quadriceps]|uniref:Uncharacterized protein LOC106748452 n=1 Tax=Dinoponera quadriceps TaxID=609295 RepID=A0A6P3XWJ4_DINQU|nr:PREDICTED: uncharacterized protein LOC106748452 [Dinoponera quadriceps]
MARYEPRATAGRVPSLFLKAEHSSQGVGYAGLGISIEPSLPTTKKASVHLTFPTPLGRRFLRIIVGHDVTTTLLRHRARQVFLHFRRCALATPWTSSDRESTVDQIIEISMEFGDLKGAKRKELRG